MMWKALIILAVTSVVLAGHVHRSEYKFHIKHDYDYLKHHEKKEHHKGEVEEKPQEEAKQKEEVKEEEQTEEGNSEAGEANESDESNAESAEPEKEKEHESPNYEFLYKVIDPHTHDKKGQHEEKHDGEVKGVYWLLQPDGYKRTVDYYVDKHNGFHAKVDYSKGEELSEEDEHSKPKSELYVKTYYGKQYIPITEEPEEEQEQDRQEESAQNIPIYVI